MSKLHRDNAGYVGCSYEETQDPYYSYNKLALPLSESNKTVIREEQTFVVTQSNGKFVIDGVSQAPLTLVEGNVYTFDLSDSSVATHPFRIKKNPVTSANSLTSGLPTGYSAITSSQYTGTVANIQTDDTNELYATGSHIDFDLGSVKVIHNFIAKFRSNSDDSYSADYRIELHSGTAFDSTTLLAVSPTLESENTTDIKTIDHDFGGVSARYVRWAYTGGGRTSYLRYFHPYIDTSNESLITSGTQGQSGATAQYVVPFGSGLLAYYCASHSGMGADIATPTNASMFDGALPILKTTDAFGKTLGSGNNADPYAANLVLAVPMNGSNGGTSFADQSSAIKGSGSAKAISVSGNTQTSTAQSQYYGSSAYFDGSGDSLSIPNSSDFDFQSDDFTMESWIYQTEQNTQYYLISAKYNSSSHSWWWAVYGDYQTCYLYPGVTLTNSTKKIPINTWTHVAVTCKNGIAKLYQNGEVINTIGFSGPMTTTSHAVTFGEDSDGNYDFKGYMADARIYKGGVKYTSNFVVPNRIDLDDLSGNDNNASNVGATWQTSVEKFYGGATEFNGSSSYLSIPASSDFNFGTGDCTIEMWAYLKAAGSTPTLISSSNYYTSASNGNWLLRRTNGAQIAFASYDGQGNAEYNELGAVTNLNAWHHIALTRRANTVQVFVDGSPGGTMTVTKSLSDGGTNGLRIGHANSNAYWNGYIQDVRVYKGIAKYTSSFSPPERSVQGTARRYPSGVYVVS